MGDAADATSCEAQAWQALDHLIEIGCAPDAYAPRLRQAPSRAAAVVCEDGHVCSEFCFFLVANENDDRFVCTLSGLTWGAQVTNGAYEARHNVDHPALPTALKSSKRKTFEPSDFRYELYSCAVRTLYKLLRPETRSDIDAARVAKARKSALRVEANALRSALAQTRCANLSSAMHASWTEMERAGGCVRVVQVKDKRVNALANTFCMIWERFIQPYSVVMNRKPTKEFFVTACAYLFAEGVGSFSDNLLAAHMPDAKHLRKYNLEVGRVTAAKRYIKESFVHYKNKEASKRRLNPPQPA